jgi:hypothetical protein
LGPQSPVRTAFALYKATVWPAAMPAPPAVAALSTATKSMVSGSTKMKYLHLPKRGSTSESRRSPLAVMANFTMIASLSVKFSLFAFLRFHAFYSRFNDFEFTLHLGEFISQKLKLSLR